MRGHPYLIGIKAICYFLIRSNMLPFFRLKYHSLLLLIGLEFISCIFVLFITYHKFCFTCKLYLSLSWILQNHYKSLYIFKYTNREIHRPYLPSIFQLETHNLCNSYIYVYAVVLGDIPVSFSFGEDIDLLFSGMLTIAANHVWVLLY